MREKRIKMLRVKEEERRQRGKVYMKKYDEERGNREGKEERVSKGEEEKKK